MHNITYILEKQVCQRNSTRNRTFKNAHAEITAQLRSFLHQGNDSM